MRKTNKMSHKKGQGHHLQNLPQLPHVWVEAEDMQILIITAEVQKKQMLFNVFHL
jgi:hypothetical protein